MSDTFCPLPWNHLATHPHGVCTLCCESEQTDGMSQAFNDTVPRTLVSLQTVDDFLRSQTQIVLVVLENKC